MSEPSTHLASFAILVQMTLLFIILLISYFLQIRKIHVIHESVVGIFLGGLVGAFVSNFKEIKQILKFDDNYFFYLILPPIILNSGYDLNTNHFFKNIGPILTFSFLGTFISTLVIGNLVYLVALTGIHGITLSYLDCLTFGAILSSTDPVTVLSIFNQLGIDDKLYAIVFGESILNDSVAIILFQSLKTIDEITIISVFYGIVHFFVMFVSSVFIGVIVALSAALMLKHLQLKLFTSLESCLVAVLAYFSYLLSNAFQISGIVSLLFCGMTMKHYCYPNMSLKTKKTTKNMFRVLSQLGENFVFIYLGINLFAIDGKYLFGLCFFTIIFVLVARYVSTVPLSKFINFLSAKIQGDHVVEVIPENHQVMLWWAGLRGAIAFALSVEVKGPASMPIRTTTLVVCVFTIVLLGGTTKFMLDYLDVPTGERSKIGEYDSSSESDYSEAEEDSLARLSGCSSNDHEDGDPLFSRKTINALRGEREISNWLVKIDKKYLKPIFCIKKTWDSKSPIAKTYEHSGIVPERDLSAKFSDSIKNTSRI